MTKNQSGVVESLLPLETVPIEPAASAILLAESTSPDGSMSIRFKKGSDPKAGDKELYIETWTEHGFKDSLKVNDKLTKVYNDTVFGGIAWSRDNKKVVFIGEQLPIEKYEPFFKDEKEEEKKEEAKGDKPAADKHYQDEKFLYKENFGETLLEKERPAIYVFDSETNKL